MTNEEQQQIVSACVPLVLAELRKPPTAVGHIRADGSTVPNQRAGPVDRRVRDIPITIDRLKRGKDLGRRIGDTKETRLDGSYARRSEPAPTGPVAAVLVTADDSGIHLKTPGSDPTPEPDYTCQACLLDGNSCTCTNAASISAANTVIAAANAKLRERDARIAVLDEQNEVLQRSRDAWEEDCKLAIHNKENVYKERDALRAELEALMVSSSVQRRDELCEQLDKAKAELAAIYQQGHAAGRASVQPQGAKAEALIAKLEALHKWLPIGEAEARVGECLALARSLDCGSVNEELLTAAKWMRDRLHSHSCIYIHLLATKPEEDAAIARAEEAQ